MARRRRPDGAVLLVLRGALNAAAAARVSHDVADCVIDAEPRIVVDLNGLDYVDTEGVDALLGARRLAKRNGCTLEIDGLEDAVARMVGLLD
jgi:anti-anti-sigma factor